MLAITTKKETTVTTYKCEACGFETEYNHLATQHDIQNHSFIAFRDIEDFYVNDFFNYYSSRIYYFKAETDLEKYSNFYGIRRMSWEGPNWYVRVQDSAIISITKAIKDMRDEINKTEQGIDAIEKMSLEFPIKQTE